MAHLAPLELENYVARPFEAFRADPVLVCESEGHANAMTIGWGSMGTLWSLPVSTVYVRTSRYTHQLISCSSRYSICWLPPTLQDAVGLCGSKSGRDLDKIAASGLTLAHDANGTPYLAESELVVACRKLHMAPIDMLGFCRDGLHGRWYQPGTANSPHVEVVGEVTALLSLQG